MKPTHDYLATRRTLISRLKDLDDADSWMDYYNTYGPMIYRFSMKQGLTDFEAQEVVQETSIAVSRNIGNFRYTNGQGSFKAWLFNLIRWRIQDQYRKRGKQMQPIPTNGRTQGTTPTNALPDPKGDSWTKKWDEEWKRSILEEALLRVRKQQDPKHYQIFDLYALKERSASDVAAMFEVSCGQVYVIKSRLSDQLKKEIEYVESKWN